MILYKRSIAHKNILSANDLNLHQYFKYKFEKLVFLHFFPIIITIYSFYLMFSIRKL